MSRFVTRLLDMKVSRSVRNYSAHGKMCYPNGLPRHIEFTRPEFYKLMNDVDQLQIAITGINKNESLMNDIVQRKALNAEELIKSIRTKLEEKNIIPIFTI